MNKKHLLVVIALVMVLAITACQPAPVVPAGTTPPTTRQLNVVGTGRVYLAPDVAYVFIGVNSQSENVSEALTQNSAKATAIANALKELGVEEKDIQTSGFNIFPQQQFSPEGQVTGIIYVVDNIVNVTVRDLGNLGSLLDASVRAGANSINGINFDVLEKTEAISQARTLAIQDAQGQAQELASAAGVELGDLIMLNSYMSTGPIPLADQKGGMMIQAAEVPISAGQLLISVDVNMTYEIR